VGQAEQRAKEQTAKDKRGAREKRGQINTGPDPTAKKFM